VLVFCDPPVQLYKCTQDEKLLRDKPPKGSNAFLAGENSAEIEVFACMCACATTAKIVCVPFLTLLRESWIAWYIDTRLVVEGEGVPLSPPFTIPKVCVHSCPREHEGDAREKLCWKEKESWRLQHTVYAYFRPFLCVYLLAWDMHLKFTYKFVYFFTLGQLERFKNLQLTYNSSIMHSCCEGT
jgi:hypothetical protein